MGSRKSCSATISNNVNVISRIKHLDRWPGHAHLCPETRHEDVLSTGGLDRCPESWIVPRIHRGPLDDWLARKNIKKLRPHIPAERFCFHRRENGRYSEFLRHLGKQRHVIDQGRTVDTGDAERHLRLVIDENNSAVFRSLEFVVLTHCFAPSFAAAS